MTLITRIAAAGLVLASVTTTAFAAGERTYLDSGKVLPTSLPLSELVVAGETLYLSGSIGNLPGTLELAPGGVEGETVQIMENIKTSLETHGYSLSNLVKCTVILADISEWGTFNGIYQSYFEDGQFPARAAFAASGLALGARVEVDCIGHK